MDAETTGAPGSGASTGARLSDALRLTQVPMRSERKNTNLPADIGPFIGRRHEVLQARALLVDRRLLTMIGVGGVGKTRLARRVAASVQRTFHAGGVWFVELGSLAEPALVPRAVADVLRISDRGGHSLAELIANRVSDAATLLVLDDCEHLVDAVVELVEEILAACPRLHVIATSRQRLGARGEAVLVVTPLSIIEARQLFLDRAAAAGAFVPDQSDRAMVDSLCERIDRLPLALELAASQLRAITLPEMLANLESGGGLAPLGLRRGAPRQRTLSATLDWSYELLDEAARQAWRQLARFESGFCLEAAQMLLGEEALPLVATLVDNSIINAETSAGRTWYRMLDTLRTYGRERLQTAGEQPQVDRQIVSYYIALAEEVERRQAGADDDSSWPAKLDQEQGNLRLALQLAGSAAGDDQIRLAAALVPYWDVRGHLEEGRGWLDKALSREDADESGRARAMEGMGWLAFRQNDYESARRYSEMACASADAVDNQAVLARARSNVGLIDMLTGRVDQARDQLARGWEIARAANMKAVEVSPLFMIAVLDYLTGDVDSAVTHAEVCLEIARQHGSLRMQALVCALLGTLRLELGDAGMARQLLDEAVTMESRIGERVNAALILGACARLAESRGESERCVELAAAAAQAELSTGASPVVVWQARVDASVVRATAALGKRRADVARRRGAEMSTIEALKLATGEPAADDHSRVPRKLHSLSRRELEIATLVGEGLPNRAIGERLRIGPRTVETHLANIFNKLGYNSRSEVATWAVRSAGAPDQTAGR